MGGAFCSLGVLVTEAERLNLRQTHTAAAIRAIQNSKRSMVISYSTDNLAV
jgi:hypothetical protein